VHEHVERFHSGSRGGRFVIINAIALGVAFGDITHLVAYNIASVILFALADEFAFQWMPATWYIGAGNETEDL